MPPTNTPREAYTPERAPESPINGPRGQRGSREPLLTVREAREAPEGLFSVIPGCGRLPRASFKGYSWVGRLPRASFNVKSRVGKLPRASLFPFHCWPGIASRLFLSLFPFHCWPVLSLPRLSSFPVSLLGRSWASLPFPFHCWARYGGPTLVCPPPSHPGYICLPGRYPALYTALGSHVNRLFDTNVAVRLTVPFMTSTRVGETR